jgi:hypothetical protein
VLSRPSKKFSSVTTLIDLSGLRASPARLVFPVDVHIESPGVSNQNEITIRRKSQAMRVVRAM